MAARGSRSSRDPGGGAARARARRLPGPLTAALLALLGLAFARGAAEAKVLLTAEEALELAFPGCTIERCTVYLTAAQVKRARELGGGEGPAALVHPYVASRDGTMVGTAYFDSHVVRTLSETVMVVVDPEDKVSRVEVLAFNEPQTYLPRAAWYGQFRGRALGPDLALQRGIRGITGATLTARATTQAVRRVLAVHRVLAEAPAPPQGR